MDLSLWQTRALETPDRITLAVFALVLALFLWRTWSQEPLWPRRWALLVLRCGMAFLLLLVFFQPVMRWRQKLSDVPVAVVVDASASMTTADSGPKAQDKRWDAALKALTLQREHLDRHFRASYYVVGQGLEGSSWEALTSRQAWQGVSDFSALRELRAKEPGLRSVLFLSDGRWGGGLEPLTDLLRLGVPIYSLGVGREEGVPDLRVASLRSPSFAFKNTPVSLLVRLEKESLDAASVSVKVIGQGQTQTSQRAVFKEGDDFSEVELTLTPDETGLHTYEVRVPVFQAESNRRNNRHRFTLDVGRDRLRVLYIAGQPGPHYAFLRHQLKTNPSVELVSFVILRDPQDVVSIPDHQLSLIPFPSQDVLMKQLSSFDMIVLEQFSFNRFGIGAQGMQALKDYVQKGGGLVLLGDDVILGPNSPYRRTVMEPLIPLVMDDLKSDGAREHPLHVALPGHPLMALTDDPAQTLQQWRELPALRGRGRFVRRAQKGAQVLAGWREDSEIYPLLTTWRQGQGRVMTLGTLSSWRWALGPAGRGQGTWIYQRFWNNTLRWMSESDDFKLVRLALENAAVPLGEEQMVRASVRDEYYRPFDRAQVKLLVRGPQGSKQNIVLKSLGQGDYAAPLLLEEGGSHRLTVRAFDRGKKIGEDRGVLEAGQLWDENRDTRPNFSFLKRLAESTGGDFSRLADWSPDWTAQRLEPLSWDYEERASLGHSLWVLLPLVLLFLVEWTLRRRWGRV